MNSTLRICSIVTFLFAALCLHSFAQDDSTVLITFDKNSKRIDFITEKELPEYKFAQRGSVQFFVRRLDEPDDFVTFFKEGVNRSYIKNLWKITKLQPQFGIWRLSGKGNYENTPTSQNVRSTAVSFIPLSTDTKKPERRVYLLLNDLQEIDFGNEQ